VKRKWIAAVALLRFMPFAAELPREQEPDLILRVVNVGQVDAQVLLKAEKEADLIFAKAGLRVSWLNCGAGYTNWAAHDPCGEPAQPGELNVMIMMHKPRTVPHDAIGFSVIPRCKTEGPGYAAVYYPHAMDIAREHDADLYQIVAAAIAHEVGHLLLGANAHSTTGIMSAPWHREQFERISIGTLVFTRNQAAMLRQALVHAPSPAKLNIASAASPK
jgi:hypothetical protein